MYGNLSDLERLTYQHNCLKRRVAKIKLSLDAINKKRDLLLERYNIVYAKLKDCNDQISSIQSSYVEGLKGNTSLDGFLTPVD